MKDYKATLKLVKNKWYASMTVPIELRNILTNQIRLSTSTNDKNEALKRLPELAIQLKKKISDANQHKENDDVKEKILSIAKNLKKEESINLNSLDKDSLITILEQFSVAHKKEIVYRGKFDRNFLREAVERQKLSGKWVDIKTKENEAQKAKQLLTEIRGANQSFKILAEEWEKVNNWNREKTRKSFISHIEKFLKVMGDLDLEDINKVMLYDFAQFLAKNKSSNQTIRNYIASVRAVLDYAERKGKIRVNPAYNLKLETYGASKKQRKPFPISIVKELFKQKLPDDIRLLWSIMITTGMRLDEVALLSLDNINEERGIRYFDLTNMKVKNEGSARKVPIPSILIDKIDNWTKDLNTERLFSFPLNVDGKAQNAASKKGMRFVRKVTSDKDLVVHSFRHTFKDLMRNAGISKDLHDFITGHSGGDVASYYGEGYSLERRKEALDKVCDFFKIDNLI